MLRMITYMDPDGTIRTGPLVTCDGCGAVVENASEGDAVWDIGPDQRGPTTREVFYTHKHCCDRFKASRGGRERWATADLADFLTNVGASLKLDSLRPTTPVAGT